MKPASDGITRLLEEAVLLVGASVWVWMSVVYATAAYLPDPALGRIFPLPDHPRIYTHPWMGWLLYGLLIATGVLIAALVLRIVGKKDES